MVLLCHVILQDHTIKVSCDFIGGRGGLFKTCYLAKFGGHRQSGIGNMMVLVYHKISQDRMIEGS